MRNKLTGDAPTLFIDQYGQSIVASTLKELMEKGHWRGSVDRQYVDKADGRRVWNGYVLGSRWFTAFKWQEVDA